MIRRWRVPVYCVRLQVSTKLQTYPPPRTRTRIKYNEAFSFRAQQKFRNDNATPRGASVSIAKVAAYKERRYVISTRIS